MLLFRRKPPQPDTRFGYALVGTGHGAQKMAEALRNSLVARVTAVVSSTPEKAASFARRHGIAATYTYDRFDQLAHDPNVDAVYLALPVSLHRHFTEQAAAAGKHVLCEKPMAPLVADAETMIAACLAADRLLMIGYRLDYDSMHAELARLLAADTFGAVRHITTGFGIVAKPGWRFDPALAGGGSLFDVGVYPIHCLHEQFGDLTITSAEILQDPATGMELDATWQGKLSNGATFTCHSSYLERVPDNLHLQAERGTLSLTQAYAYERTSLDAEFTDRTGQHHALHLRDNRRNPSLFCLEAEHLAEAARGLTPLRSPGESGLRDLETIAQIEAIATRKSR